MRMSSDRHPAFSPAHISVLARKFTSIVGLRRAGLGRSHSRAGWAGLPCLFLSSSSSVWALARLLILFWLGRPALFLLILLLFRVFLSSCSAVSEDQSVSQSVSLASIHGVHALLLLHLHARRRQGSAPPRQRRLPRVRHLAARGPQPRPHLHRHRRRALPPHQEHHRRASDLPLLGEENEPGQQGVLLQPQDQEAAVCEPAVQEAVVGGRQALRQAQALHQGPQDHREARPRRRCQEGRDRPQQEMSDEPWLRSSP